MHMFTRGRRSASSNTAQEVKTEQEGKLGLMQTDRWLTLSALLEKGFLLFYIYFFNLNDD